MSDTSKGSSKNDTTPGVVPSLLVRCSLLVYIILLVLCIISGVVVFAFGELKIDVEFDGFDISNHKTVKREAGRKGISNLNLESINNKRNKIMDRSTLLSIDDERDVDTLSSAGDKLTHLTIIYKATGDSDFNLLTEETLTQISKIEKRLYNSDPYQEHGVRYSSFSDHNDSVVEPIASLLQYFFPTVLFGQKASVFAASLGCCSNTATASCPWWYNSSPSAQSPPKECQSECCPRCRSCSADNCKKCQLLHNPMTNQTFWLSGLGDELFDIKKVLYHITTTRHVNQISWFMGNNFKNGSLEYLRSEIALYNHQDSLENMRELVRIIKQSYSSNLFSISYGGSVITAAEIEDAIWNDLALVVVSLLIILIYLFLFLSSAVLAFCCMLQLLLTIPVSLFVYTILLKESYIGPMNVLSVFVLLGIGVDDIFIFYCAFNSSERDLLDDSASMSLLEVTDGSNNNNNNNNNNSTIPDGRFDNSYETDPFFSTESVIRLSQIKSTLEREIDIVSTKSHPIHQDPHHHDNELSLKLSDSYSSAGVAMLVTSTTSAIAFLSNAVSSIPAVRGFGILMGTIIVVNYILVMTMFPTVLVLHVKFVVPVWNRLCDMLYAIYNNKKESLTDELHCPVGILHQISNENDIGLNYQRTPATVAVPISAIRINGEKSFKVSLFETIFDIDNFTPTNFIITIPVRYLNPYAVTMLVTRIDSIFKKSLSRNDKNDVMLASNTTVEAIGDLNSDFIYLLTQNYGNGWMKSTSLLPVIDETVFRDLYVSSTDGNVVKPSVDLIRPTHFVNHIRVRICDQKNTSKSTTSIQTLNSLDHPYDKTTVVLDECFVALPKLLVLKKRDATCGGLVLRLQDDVLFVSEYWIAKIIRNTPAINTKIFIPVETAEGWRGWIYSKPCALTIQKQDYCHSEVSSTESIASDDSNDFITRFISPLLYKLRFPLIVLFIAITIVSMYTATLLGHRDSPPSFFESDHRIYIYRHRDLFFLKSGKCTYTDRSSCAPNYRERSINDLMDCKGDLYGLHVVDLCGVCGGHSDSCTIGCDGVASSKKSILSCGKCGLHESECSAPPGCDGIIGSEKLILSCGICGLRESDCDLQKGCDGVPGSHKTFLSCGKCGIKESECTPTASCDGIPESGKTILSCGICGFDESECQSMRMCDNMTCTQCDGHVINQNQYFKTWIDDCGTCGPPWPTGPSGRATEGSSCRGCDFQLQSKSVINQCGSCVLINSSMEGSCSNDVLSFADSKSVVSTTTIQIHLVFGIDYSASEFTNTEIYSRLSEPHFSLSWLPCQSHAITVCNEVLSSSIENGNIASGGNHFCLPLNFSQHLIKNNKTATISDANQYYSELNNYITSEHPPGWLYDVSKNHLVLTLKTETPTESSAYHLIDEFKFWEQLQDRLNDDAPSGGSHSCIFYQTAKQWSKAFIQVIAVNGLAYAVGISLITTFITVWMFTASCFLTILIISTLVGIISSTFCIIYLLGWEIGAVEAVSLSVVIGLSIDFSLHFGESYTSESMQTLETDIEFSRKSIIYIVLRSMCKPLCHAALTTMLSTFPLLFCTLLPLRQFGWILITSIGVSITFSILMFVPVLAVVGPTPFKKTITSRVVAIGSPLVIIGTALLLIHLTGTKVYGPDGEVLFF